MKKIKHIIIAAAIASGFHASSFDLSSVESLYLVGDAVATGWDRGKAPKLTQIAPGVFAWNGDLFAGEFKFLISRDSWSSVVAENFNQTVWMNVAMGVTDNDEGDDHDAKWIVSTPGNYTLKVDINAATLTVSSFSAEGAVEYEATAFGGFRHKCCEILSSGSFIVKASDDQGNVRYLHVGADGGYLFVESPEFASVYPVNSSAEHDQVLIDTEAMTLRRNVYRPWTNLYIVGGFNGWAFNDKFALSDDDPNSFVWSGEIELADGEMSEVKFKGNNEYTAGEDIWGVHPFVDRQPFTEADHVVLGGADDFKWLISRSGSYTVTVNPFLLTASVTIAGTVLTGDANGDGAVNVSDVTSMIDYMLGNVSGNFDLEAADINADGVITVVDITGLIDLMLK